jgi:simple sugar transport system ATP-binding protein
MNALTKALDQWFGRGEFSITTPPMDGAFRPNDLLDVASVCLEAPAPDGLAATSQGVLVSSARSLLRVDAVAHASPVAPFEAEIAALTGLPDGGAAVCLADGRIVFAGGARAGKTIAAPPELRCVTALAPARPLPARADPTGRRQTTRRVETLVAEPILRAHRPSRRRVQPDRELPQPGERPPARRHLLPFGRQARLFHRQGRRRRRLLRRQGGNRVTSPPGAVSPLLQMKGVEKQYRGVAALRSIDFDLRRGETHAILGENGAGKSTLVKILAGAVAPTRGEIRLEGERIQIAGPASARSHGIAMVYQETSLVPTMTVAQNLYLGDEKFFNRLRGTYIDAQQFLQSLNFPVDPTASVQSLGTAKRQMVEIARAVRLNAKVIIFDEPTATLTPEEKHHLFALIDRLRSGGVSIIFISHAIEEALEISDRITILRDGEHVVTADAKSFTRETVIRHMVGRSLTDELYGRASAPRTARPAGAKVLSVQNISMQNLVRNTSFSIFAGQITGIFGLVGSGRTETARIVAGVAKRDAFHGGDIRFEGRSVRYRTPRSAVADGVVYVTEDRKGDGFFETMSVADNIYIGQIASRESRGVLASRKETQTLAARWTKKLNIRALNPDSRVIELSGGNQQKVVIAKGLVQNPRLVIFDEPTRGVDVGAIAEIHQLIGALAEDGLAVIVISSYLPEILSLSDRILVSRQGRIVEELSPDEATPDAVMFAAVY